jgi:hypothetical protein
VIPSWLASLLGRVAARQESRVMPPAVIDRRAFASQSHHGWPVKRRSLSKVTGVCLHQTACNMGTRPARYDGTGSHVVVTGGQIIWLHDWTHRVVAASGWNDATVSIEINGLFAGVEGDPRTVWDDPSTPGREQAMALDERDVLATLDVLRWMKREIPGLRVIVAHRQASADRRNDPGEAIWRRVAIPARAEVGLVTPNEFTLGDGLPIPNEWDDRAKAHY